MTFLSYTKIRPGAYFNFKSVPRPLIQVGNRGIATIPIELNWGATGELIELYSDELLNGESQAKVGFTAFDSESKLVNLMLQYCYKVLLYRVNGNGAKASATITSGESDENTFNIIAKYAGTYGNNIVVSIVANGVLFDVSTFVNGSQKDIQTVATINELEANDYVEFTGNGDIPLNAGITLTGGTNGTTPTKNEYYPAYFELLETAKFQTIGCPDLKDTDAAIKANVLTFIKNQRENEERFEQAVVANYATADYEGIISVKNGFVKDGISISKEEATAVVAAMTAGANINESNTNRVVTGATDLVGKYKNSEIIEALKNGEFIFTANSRGEIKVEKDINSLHTFTVDKNYEFSKNRVVRVLDEIGTSIKDIWEQSYMGKVSNNEDYREVFRGDVIAYCTELERLAAIQEFLPEDIEVLQGQQLDDVITNSYIKPVDSMEKLYFTCNVRS